VNYLRRALAWIAPALLLAAAYSVLFLVASILHALHMPDGRLMFGVALVGFGMEFALIGLFSLVIAGIEEPSKGNCFRDHLRPAGGLYCLTLFALLLLIIGAGHVSGALTNMVCVTLGAGTGNAYALYLKYEYVRAAA
jgi:hypothetical protein